MYKNCIRNLAPLVSGIGTHKTFDTLWVFLDIVCAIDVRVYNGCVIIDGLI